MKTYETASSVDELREVQRLWIPYRDNSTKLFVALNPVVDEMTWKSWLTEVREKQLREIFVSVDIPSFNSF